MNNKINDSQLIKRLLSDAKRITNVDLQLILEKAEKISSMFNSGPLNNVYKYGQLLIALIKDYYSGNYRQISWVSVAISVAALLYILDPIDIFPDFLPIIGQIDDLAVVGLAVRFIKEELDRYEMWCNRNIDVIDV
ncbi:MAG: YkvA family protein [Dissulfuribacterales bacterium]